MSRQGARVLLVVSCLVAAAAVFQSFRFSQSHEVGRNALVAVEREGSGLVARLTELRGAQMAYLATGQGPDFWMGRATDLATNVEQQLTLMRSSLTSAAAQSQIDTALVALADLMKLDARARTAIETDQRFLASDVIFADGVAATQRVSDAIDAARVSELGTIEATLERDRVLQLALFPTALVLVLISAWLAGGGFQRGPARSEAEEVAQMLRALPPPVKAPGVAVTLAPPVATPPSRTVPATPPPAEARSVNLTDAAELCVDLARVIDGRDLPSLLQRAARTLEATGIIIWVVDTPGVRLTPALAHGYSERVLAKLGTLDVNADNVTSLSFRSMRPQAMPGAGSNGASSAIAVPLVTTEGCNGVLAAEVPGTRPTDDCLAVARILAAQLATMLSPLEPSAQRAAEA